jgi:DNA-binding NtrC family response regulator
MSGDPGERAAGAALDPLKRLDGDSRAMRAVRERLRRLGPRDAPVLVQGESGTGKEVVARAIHWLSPRAGGAFVPVDCGATSESLLESELFGHARGAFTGAQAERRGLFEEADGGTLFLDEIANTSLAFQARLLRALQEREIRPVGSSRPRPVDVRVVAASNRDLGDEVVAGRFREDLLYRLDVLSVSLPPLRRRREDVPVLARSLLRRIEARTGERLTLTPGALAALGAWSWPGNVRELLNVLESAAAFALDGRIDVAQLPERLHPGRGAGPAGPPTLPALLAEFERSVVRQGLEEHGWNRTRAARALGITRRCLFDKIAKHGLAPPA